MHPPLAELHTAQDQAILQFRAWAAKQVPCLDTETTGMEGQVWQLALVEQDTLTPRLHFTCQPEGEWSPKAAEMRDAHGADLSQCPPASAFTAQLPQGQQFLTWNAPFDLGAIARTWPDWQVRGECAMEAYAPLAERWSESLGLWKYVSLGEACTAEQVDVSHLAAAHNAYGDACRLALLVQAVARRETHAERAARETAP